MIGNGGSDIIEQIDALTEPGEDAATWTASGVHEKPVWNNPSPKTMTAVLLDITGASFVEISTNNPDEDLARLVGDPLVDHISHLRAVRFWVGDNSVASTPINHRATRFVHYLLRAVRSGDYVASDSEREHARGLLDSPDTAPIIHGPCLITGVGPAGAPGPLDENFQHWFTKILDRGAQVEAAVALRIAQVLGIRPELIGQIVIIGSI